jgi:TatD DNase family protein
MSLKAGFMSEVTLFDTHAHLSSNEQEKDELLIRSSQAGVKTILDIATDQKILEKSLQYEIKKREVALYLAAAVTPHDVLLDNEAYFSLIAKSAQEKRLVAIGETGLDFFHAKGSKEVQERMLERHLQLAFQEKLPLIIHCRDAFLEFFSLFDRVSKSLKYSFEGVMHCFTGTKEQAKQALDRGLLISFSGIITFPSAAALREVVPYIPDDRLLIETDSPFLAPVPYRGKENEPAYLTHVCRSVAQLRALSFEECARLTTANAKRVFHI